MAEQAGTSSARSIDRPDVRPAAFAHIFFKTKRFQEMVDFYCTVLNAQVAHGNDKVAFLTYDDENHRVAITHMPDLQDPDPTMSGLEHFAYTYATLGDLFANYTRLKVLGILPYWCINHGPTTSLYYHDPDGNQLETQVDNFSRPEELAAFLRTPEFAANPLGIQFEPDRMVERYVRGDSEEDLKRADVAPRAAGARYDFFAFRGVEEAVLHEVEAKRCRALVDADLGTVDDLLAEDLVHIHGDGRIDDKSGYIRGLREKYVFHHMSRPGLRVWIFGNTAIMSGPLKQAFSRRGSDTRYEVEGVASQTWIKSAGHWRLVSCHNSFRPVA